MSEYESELERFLSTATRFDYDNIDQYIESIMKDDMENKCKSMFLEHSLSIVESSGAPKIAVHINVYGDQYMNIMPKGSKASRHEDENPPITFAEVLSNRDLFNKYSQFMKKEFRYMDEFRGFPEYIVKEIFVGVFKCNVTMYNRYIRAADKYLTEKTWEKDCNRFYQAAQVPIYDTTISGMFSFVPDDKSKYMKHLTSDDKKKLYCYALFELMWYKFVTNGIAKVERTLKDMDDEFNIPALFVDVGVNAVTTDGRGLYGQQHIKLAKNALARALRDDLDIDLVYGLTYEIYGKIETVSYVLSHIPSLDSLIINPDKQIMPAFNRYVKYGFAYL